MALRSADDRPDTAQMVGDMVRNGSSPQAEAARVLQDFMSCQAGVDLVEHALLRPYGYSLDAGRVISENRLLRDDLECAQVRIASALEYLDRGDIDDLRRELAGALKLIDRSQARPAV